MEYHSNDPPKRQGIPDVKWTKHGEKRFIYNVNLRPGVEYFSLYYMAIDGEGRYRGKIKYFVPRGIGFFPCPACIASGRVNSVRVCTGIDVCPSCRIREGTAFWMR